MIRLGLIGYPVAHSLSPVLHQAALVACGLRGEYSLYPVAPDDLSSLRGLLECVRGGELTGLNVTIPHKQTLVPLLDELSPAAAAIGAVNTIYLREGKLFGANTDAPAFLTDLEQHFSTPQSAMLLGAGGAARSVLYGLRSYGCKISVVARRTEQAQILAQQFGGVKVIELAPQTLREIYPELIVNTTPVGMFPDLDHSPWPGDLAFPELASVYDLIYNPRETLLVRRARAAGLKAATGLGMLVEQAALAFELWTGRRIERSLMFDAAKQVVQ